MGSLILLHGFAGGPWSYDAVVARARPREILRPILSYHDPAEGLPLHQLDFLDEVTRLAALIRASAFTPIDLVGYSMGGRLALGLAVAHPELVRRLILISSRRGLDSEAEREARRAADAAWASMVENEGLATFLERFWSQPLFDSLRRAPRQAVELEFQHRSRHSAVGLAAALRHLGLGNQPSYAAEVCQLGLPVTLVAGDLDQKFLALSEDLRASLPLGRLVVVKGAGHHLLIEAPSAVARIINEEIER